MKRMKHRIFSYLSEIGSNDFHPLVWISGDPIIGENVYIGGFSEVNAKGAKVYIGRNCDIASFVSINCADSHLQTIKRSEKISRKDIRIGNHVFIGSHSVIKGGVEIGDHSVVAAGTIVDPGIYPRFSLIYGNPSKVKEGYYTRKNDCT